MSGLHEELDDMRRRLSELERRIRSQSRTGVVAEVDPAGGVARVRLQDGEKPFLTGWIPWEEASAGANKTHNPPSVGQQVKVYSESGDLHDATIQGSLNSDANGRPSGAGDEFVLASIGSFSMRITGGGTALALTVGGFSMTVTASGVVNTGGTLTHDGKDIGSTHTHGGVTGGSSSTAVPN